MRIFKRKQSRQEPLNLLELVPHRLRDWERSEEGRVVILKPKLGDNPIGRWLMARMPQPYYRINLDDFGSHVWELCDGNTTVREIGKALRQRFGDSVEPVYDRLAIFFRQLERGRLIRLQPH